MKTTKSNTAATLAHTISSTNKQKKTLSKKSSFKQTTVDKENERTITTKESDAGIHLTQILNYYRERVEAFEKDRV